MIYFNPKNNIIMKTKLLLLLLLNSVVIMLNGQIKDSLNAKFVNPNIEKDKILVGNVLRVESKLTATWSGVRSCSDISIHKQNIETTANNWIKNKMFEHRNEKWIRYGWDIPKITIRNGRNPFPNRSRYCRGTANYNIYIEFEK